MLKILIECEYNDICTSSHEKYISHINFSKEIIKNYINEDKKCVTFTSSYSFDMINKDKLNSIFLLAEEYFGDIIKNYKLNENIILDKNSILIIYNLFSTKNFRIFLKQKNLNKLSNEFNKNVNDSFIDENISCLKKIKKFNSKFNINKININNSYILFNKFMKIVIDYLKEDKISLIFS